MTLTLSLTSLPARVSPATRLGGNPRHSGQEEGEAWAREFPCAHISPSSSLRTLHNPAQQRKEALIDSSQLSGIAELLPVMQPECAVGKEEGSSSSSGGPQDAQRQPEQHPWQELAESIRGELQILDEE